MTLAYDSLIVRPRPVSVPRPLRPVAGPNRLLESLGPDAAALTPWLRASPLAQGETLQQADEPVRYVDFPTSGAVGLAAGPDGEGSPDALLVGRDGAIGAIEALSGVAPVERAVVRQGGTSLRIEASRFREAAERLPTLRAALDRWAARQLAELRRTVACAATHRLEGRLATWLLRCRERSGAEVLAIRQEELAEALGVQRTSINAAAQTLQAAGAVRTGRGRIMVPDETALRRRACGCLDHG